MARLVFIPNETTFILLESPIQSAELLLMVNTGEWRPPAPYDQVGQVESQTYKAVRLGQTVIVTAEQSLLPPTDGGVVEGQALHLSPRQEDVLQLLSQGMTNKEIAEQMCLSRHTVAVHIQALKTRLGARTRAQSISRAAGLGLIKMKKRPEE